MPSNSDQYENPDQDENPLANPLYRYLMGLGSAAVLVVVAVVLLEGTLQLLVIGLAVVEAVAVPKFLEVAIRNQAEADGSATD